MSIHDDTDLKLEHKLREYIAVQKARCEQAYENIGERNASVTIHLTNEKKWVINCYRIKAIERSGAFLKVAVDEFLEGVYRLKDNSELPSLLAAPSRDEIPF